MPCTRYKWGHKCPVFLALTQPILPDWPEWPLLHHSPAPVNLALVPYCSKPASIHSAHALMPIYTLYTSPDILKLHFLMYSALQATFRKVFTYSRAWREHFTGSKPLIDSLLRTHRHSMWCHFMSWHGTISGVQYGTKSSILRICTTKLPT